MCQQFGGVILRDIQNQIKEQQGSVLNLQVMVASLLIITFHFGHFS
jgi:hypothetical protein